ncbi:MAG: DUF4328 domain-containing protein [Actinobacteria bacterium]|nr:DUF4328 domain-containing protein [Actinomycetota bacterium]
MTEPVFRQGQWYQQGADGTWLKWDAAAAEWKEQSAPPPPPSPADVQPPSPQANYEIERFRSPRGAARPLLTMLAIGLGLHLIGIFAALSVLDLAGKVDRGGFVTQEEADSRAAMIGVSIFGELAILLVAGIIFLVWFRRAYRNLPALGARNLRFTPGWAVGAWFVPILGYWRPAQIACDVWKASDPEMHEAVDTPWKVRPVSALVGWWWALWIISNFTSNVPFIAMGQNETPTTGDLMSFARGWIFAEIVWGAASILTILFVARVTARQEERARRLTVSGAVVPGLTS